MTEFVTMIEEMLLNSGRDNWELIYIPQEQVYMVKIGGKRIYLWEVEPYDQT